MAATAEIRGEHAVQFYESDAELTASVVPYLAAGAREGEALVVIADDVHRRGFEEGLAAAGVDLAGARASEALVSLDAAMTLSALMPSGGLDPQAFDAVIGGVLRRAAGRARGIRAYGEMVALLWAAGDVPGAIELERLWNELAQEIDFSLFCAYPAASVEDAAERSALHEVCDLHSVIVTTAGTGPSSRWTEHMHFPPELESCARARLFVRSTLRRRGRSGDAVEDAALVTSELATNAVVHARSGFSVEVGVDGEALRVTVSDTAPVPSAAWTVQPRHGLSLVDALSDRWGVSATREGKAVRAELAAGSP
jgi:hypothetical protein